MTIATAERSPQPSFASRLIRFLRLVVLATVLGPLVAGVSVFLVGAIFALLQGGMARVGFGATISRLAGLLVEIVRAVYLPGGVIAMISSVLVASWSLRRLPNFLVVAGAVVLANLIFFAIYEPDVLFPADSLTPQRGFWVSIALSLYAAAVCWLPARRFLRRR